jgi:Beta-lactamase class C and other penicillin binding proteins
MRRYLTLAAGTLALVAIWGALVFAGLSEGWVRRPIATRGDAQEFFAAAHDIAKRRNRGNIALVLVEDGRIAGDFGKSQGAPVDRHSLFQVASLGKWLTAWGVMALVEQGRVDLDAPVSTYLTRWHLPDSAFDTDGVTVRRLLSHTSGLGDGLGYDGFATAEQRQSLEQSLTRAADASPDKSGTVVLTAEPGSGWHYSGGGYTILQLLIEEVSGQSFASYMEETVFAPLGMHRTTFDHDRAIALGLSENFRPDGTTEPLRWYTALAATSLFTTPDDLARFLQAQGPQSGGQRVLSPETLERMASPHAHELGAAIWGLGPMLYAPDNRGGFIIGHDGQNGPAINTAARLDAASGDGLVVLATGNGLLASEIAGEWVFWKTGNVDNIAFAAAIPAALAWFATGVLVILVAAGLMVRRMRRVSVLRDQS